MKGGDKDEKDNDVIGGIGGVALIAIGMTSAQQEKAGSIPVKGEDEAGFAGMAKIPLDSAIKRGSCAVPGKVVKTELENENGYLVYGIEIAKADREMADVKVDAGDGKVLKIDTDRENHEGHEGEDSENGHEEGGKDNNNEGWEIFHPSPFQGSSGKEANHDHKCRKSGQEI